MESGMTMTGIDIDHWDGYQRWWWLSTTAMAINNGDGHRQWQQLSITAMAADNGYRRQLSTAISISF